MDATVDGFAKGLAPRSRVRTALTACALFGAGSVSLCLAGPSSPATFTSPDEAGRALLAAVQAHEEPTVVKILGGRHELVSADDPTEERLERERFAEKYQEMHRWVREPGGIRILYIGAENWPFPIPLVSRNGQWRFDSKAGSEEILFRRIGENEMMAIGMCETLVEAQTHPGTNSDADHEVHSLLPGIGDSGKAIPLHGYYYRILQNSHDGFTAVAYPAAYRSSGVKTFIVTQDGAVSEKDLGADTAKSAGAMTASRVDATWTPVQSSHD